jgi:very-short-patch-repair endonuclease
MDEPETKVPLSHRERDRERGSNELLLRARDTRRQASEAERTLWKYLRGHRLNGYKFRRQMIIDSYIVDFACLEARLIVEADGGQHVDQITYDERRTARLGSMGYRVLRFWNHEILCELQSVLEQIESALNEPPHPDPLPEGEGTSTKDQLT